MATISTERIDKRIAKLEELLASQGEMKKELEQLREARDTLGNIASLLPTRGPKSGSGTGGRKRRGRPRGSKNAE